MTLVSLSVHLGAAEEACARTANVKIDSKDTG
jgi:hypothetical protein